MTSYRQQVATRLRDRLSQDCPMDDISNARLLELTTGTLLRASVELNISVENVMRGMSIVCRTIQTQLRNAV